LLKVAFTWAIPEGTFTEDLFLTLTLDLGLAGCLDKIQGSC
jgi:hypothetical protein